MTSNDETSAMQTAHVHTWRILVELDLSGEPGSEHLAADRVADIVQSLDWSAAQLERLKLALIRALLNTMERAHAYDSKAPPVIRVLTPQGGRPERAADEPRVESTQPQPAKRRTQQSRQAPTRGWGFFLIEKTVQGRGRRGLQHFVELFLYPEGEKRDPNRR